MPAPSAPLNFRRLVNTPYVQWLRWDRPSDNGGSAVLDYRVEYKEATSSTWSLAAANTTDGVSEALNAFSFSPVGPGRTYNVRVRARNSLGSGPWANRTFTVTNYTPPPPAEQPRIRVFDGTAYQTFTVKEFVNGVYVAVDVYEFVNGQYKRAQF